MKKKVVAFTIADQNNLKYYEMLKNSLRKFHSEEELPLILIGPERLDQMRLPDKFYLMTPYIAKGLIQEYETVVKLDADQIITDRLDEALKGDFDVACVNNSNPREMAKNPVSVWNIHPLAYVNCGFVVMKSEAFIKHWWKLCTGDFFRMYQYREQDLLNICVFYGDYVVRFLDQEEAYYGLASKGYWNDIELRDDKLVLPKGSEWPDRDKIIRIIHTAGGNDPMKMNLRPYFKPEIIKHLEKLTDTKI